MYMDSRSTAEEFEMGKAIGEGAYATVYRAAHRATGRLCAVKRIRLSCLDERGIDNCLKEVGLLRGVNHENIVQYIDSFIDHETRELVIALEWAEAGDLKRQVRRAIRKGGRFDEKIIWKLFTQMAKALQHMHHNRIMHRDLKPANVFLMSDGTVKVGDLGLGRYLNAESLEARTKVGTPLYMAPEVLTGSPYDWSADIWSLGCILHELTTLKAPFKEDGMTLQLLCQKVMSEEPPPVPDSYSSALQELCRLMLSFQPEERPDIETVVTVAEGALSGDEAALSPAELHRRQQQLRAGSDAAQQADAASAAPPVAAASQGASPRQRRVGKAAGGRPAGGAQGEPAAAALRPVPPPSSSGRGGSGSASDSPGAAAGGSAAAAASGSSQPAAGEGAAAPIPVPANSASAQYRAATEQ